MELEPSHNVTAVSGKHFLWQFDWHQKIKQFLFNKQLSLILALCVGVGVCVCESGRVIERGREGERERAEATKSE